MNNQVRTHLSQMNEERRRAPGHYAAKAINAWMAAYCLHEKLDDGTLSKAADEIGYGGNSRTAIREAFNREASIALELVIKATIATKIERGVGPKDLDKPPLTHDVVQLWGMAGLPKLSPEEKLVLHRVKSLLEWSSRYGAPRDDAKQEKARAAENAVLRKKGGNGFLRTGLSFDWECFNKLFNIAQSEMARTEKEF